MSYNGQPPNYNNANATYFPAFSHQLVPQKPQSFSSHTMILISVEIENNQSSKKPITSKTNKKTKFQFLKMKMYNIRVIYCFVAGAICLIGLEASLYLAYYVNDMVLSTSASIFTISSNITISNIRSLRSDFSSFRIFAF